MNNNKKLISIRISPDILEWIDKTTVKSSYYNRTAVIEHILKYVMEEATPVVQMKMIYQSYWLKENKEVEICLKK